MDKTALLVIGNILDKTESQNGVLPMLHEIDLLFANDVAIARAICGGLYGVAFSATTPARQMALISIVFNLGGPRLASFRRMRAAIHHEYWMQAASEARHSLWAKQVGRRSTEIASILASGFTPNV